MFEDLPQPTRYFPIERGVYEVAAGLKPLGQEHVFQIDNQFEKYRTNKEACRAENLKKYFLTQDYSPTVSREVNRFLVHQFVKEHPTHFSWDGSTLQCALTGDELKLDSNYELVSHDKYVSAFDALCSQVQEDIAVMRRDTSIPKNWLAALHLCSPSHWAASQKIGKNFFDIHSPVAGIEKLNKFADNLVDTMIRKGPFSRFVWSFGTDDRLNHHPDAPPGWDPAEWKGRTFRRTGNGSPFMLRVERQVLWGLPEVDASVFMIRTSFVDGNEIRRSQRERSLLRAGLLSMTPESRIYKGLDSCFDEIISWLDEADEAVFMGIQVSALESLDSSVNP
ncbi:DUF3445 domain-containing protein [bacterium]|jgi:hypothetical protein|nr:DUF3445 domain-containing protein [bacterium]